VDKNLVIKFLKKQCSPDEAQKVVEWMHSKDFEPGLMSQIESDLNYHLGTSVSSNEDIKAILERILLKDQMDRVGFDSHTRRIHTSNSDPMRYLLKIAASVAIVFMLSYLWVNYSRNVVPADDIQIVAKYVVKENSKGRKSTIFLPDGTVVNLNAASSIRYRENFSDSARVVYLDGEAFFDVASDTLRPFVVLSDNLSITALGTSFNVNSYSESGKVAVSLATGKVVVEEINKLEKIVLEPGQQVQYNKVTNQMVKVDGYSMKAVYGWKDGIIHFRSAGFSEVISRLELWYGVEFVINKQSPLPWSYTGEFKNQSLKSVLESLSFSHNFNYQINDTTVMITFK
jgi:transmembrane sensor